MHFLLSLIGFIVLFFVAVVAIVVLKIYMGFRRLRQAMKKGGGSDDNGASREHYSQYTHRTTRTSDGTTIIDRRDPSKANKKIFAPDEGEYVDFTES